MHTTAQIQMGLRIVSAILGTLVVLYALNFLLRLLTSGFSLLGTAQDAFMVWMCWSCYTGKIWARMVLALLLLLFGASAVFFGAQAQGGDTVTVIIGLLEIAGAVSLFAIPQVNAYFEYVAQQV